MIKITIFIIAGLGMVFSGWAANTRIAAGGTLTLPSDLVLTGSDTLEVLGTASDSCTITGNKFAIRTSGNWTGLVRILYTRLNDLGVGGGGQYDVTGCGFDLTGTASALIQIEHCAVARSGTIKVTNNGLSATWFRCNNILVNSTVSIDLQPATTGYVFYAQGNSQAKKYFQGNFIAVAVISIAAPQWLVGGPGDSTSNIFIGNRVTLYASGSGTLVSYNYWHNPAKWTQVHTVTITGGAVCEHNVIRDGEWIVQFCDGEFRENVICDIYDHDLYRGGNKGRFYRNLWLSYDPPNTNNHGQQFPNMVISNDTSIWSLWHGTTGVDIFNNVFDGGEFFMMPSVEVGNGAWINTLRNNVFCGFKLDPAYAGGTPAAIIRGGDVRYADYNCFYNPSTPGVDNYHFTMAGKSERVDEGFGKHDLPAGGAANAQVDPKFKGPRVTAFPYNDTDILAGRVTVSQMIREFFDRYTPAAGSPLIDAGDPADGAGIDIGAVETGNAAINKDEGRSRPSQGVGAESRVALMVSPNPVSKAAMISFHAPSTGFKLFHLSIYNPSGSLVTALAGHVGVSGMNTVSWDATTKNSGMYVVRLHVGRDIFTQNFIVSK
jgi:hypothetical protein